MSQKLIFILIASLLVFLVDLYVFQAVRTVSQNLSSSVLRGITAFYWLFFGFTIFILSLAVITRGAPPSNFKTFLAAFLFIVFISKLFIILVLLLDDGIRLGKLIARLFTGSPATPSGGTGISRNEFLNKMALFTGLIPFTTFLYGVVRGAYQYQVKKSSAEISEPAGRLPWFSHASDLRFAYRQL
jgi:hypothetical protein